MYFQSGKGDFVPKHLPDKTWENLSDLLPAAQDWIDAQEKDGWRVLNMQTLEVKLGSMGIADSRGRTDVTVNVTTRKLLEHNDI